MKTELYAVKYAVEMKDSGHGDMLAIVFTGFLFLHAPSKHAAIQSVVSVIELPSSMQFAVIQPHVLSNEEARSLVETNWIPEDLLKPIEVKVMEIKDDGTLDMDPKVN